MYNSLYIIYIKHILKPAYLTKKCFLLLLFILTEHKLYL